MNQDEVKRMAAAAHTVKRLITDATSDRAVLDAECDRVVKLVGSPPGPPVDATVSILAVVETLVHCLMAASSGPQPVMPRYDIPTMVRIADLLIAMCFEEAYNGEVVNPLKTNPYRPSGETIN